MNKQIEKAKKWVKDHDYEIGIIISDTMLCLGAAMIGGAIAAARCPVDFQPKMVLDYEAMANILLEKMNQG